MKACKSMVKPFLHWPAGPWKHGSSRVHRPAAVIRGTPCGTPSPSGSPGSARDAPRRLHGARLPGKSPCAAALPKTPTLPGGVPASPLPALKLQVLRAGSRGGSPSASTRASTSGASSPRSVAMSRNSSRVPSTIGADESSCASASSTYQPQAQQDGCSNAVLYFSDSGRRCGLRRPMPPPICTEIVPRTKPSSQDPLRRLVARGGFADSQPRCGKLRPMPVSLDSC
ncbi:unnamed protein product [Prorocentrum cordatum]|uniref:Uncharacterized protein n=1 Tax=Prorocentrum cordatum TaxID=2364126 RepID=A0ABN9WSC6_9DINO|nr:unnamed protein product [Polarella glacialis]